MGFGHLPCVVCIRARTSSRSSAKVRAIREWSRGSQAVVLVDLALALFPVIKLAAQLDPGEEAADGDLGLVAPDGTKSTSSSQTSWGTQRSFRAPQDLCLTWCAPKILGS